MDSFTPKGNRSLGPEAKIQLEIISALKAADWLVIVMVASQYQIGVPDLYACHAVYGPRWIEVKNKEAYKFTPAQRLMFPKLTSVNAGVWILCSAEPTELAKLHKPSNWWTYL